ncbi:hypothetical protein BKA70DRAFT_795155 [Coprinopsis sp. MPI-PUGE-AT-0042]|nr:hypothetical protein BKA70DRAFT_795155 [Coprinopsis sp. MPI-PUGE-AT-0042]
MPIPASAQHIQPAAVKHRICHPFWISVTMHKTKPTVKRQALYHPSATHRLLQRVQRQPSRCLNRTKLPRSPRRAAFTGRGWWKIGFHKSTSSAKVGRGAQSAGSAELEKNGGVMVNRMISGLTGAMGEFEGKAKGCIMVLKKPPSGSFRRQATVNLDKTQLAKLMAEN